MSKDKVCIHFIDTEADKIVAKSTVFHVPRVGDEIRLHGGAGKGKFFEVIQVVWVYDEPDSLWARVNIGVEKL